MGVNDDLLGPIYKPSQDEIETMREANTSAKFDRAAIPGTYRTLRGDQMISATDALKIYDWCVEHWCFQ